MLSLLLTPHAALAVLVLAALYLVVKRALRRSIAHLPGPHSNSWLLGNAPDFQRSENAGEADFKWSGQYGLAFRTKACFGEDELYLADPKALRHILNESGYKYSKPLEARSRLRLLVGGGILWAEGTQHARHRKIMNSAFSSSALKRYLTFFFEIAHKTTNIWKATLYQQDKKSSVIDVSSWLTRATLDVIGAAALGHNFNAIEGGGSELYNAYRCLIDSVPYMPSNFSIVFRKALGYVPSDFLDIIPKKDLQGLRRCRTLTHKLGENLLSREKLEHITGKENGNDVMSIFVKANLSENPKHRLGDEEVISQIMTLMLAGHQTSATTLSWVLFELSNHPNAQDKLRDEIRATREITNARGGNLLISDLESMKYTVSVIKETLRLYPIVMQLVRRAGHDDIIPLEYPQNTVSGGTITAIPVSKGQNVVLSFCVYNRLKIIWGDDADQWRPERFLEPLPNESNISLGVFGNLATFGSGLRSCIGWRFSVLEMQAILIELIEHFEFHPPPEDVEIRRGIATNMFPVVKGQESKGQQLPLTVFSIA